MSLWLIRDEEFLYSKVEHKSKNFPEDILEFFHTYGFVVFRDVFSVADCEASREAIWDVLEAQNEGLDRHVESKWSQLKTKARAQPVYGVTRNLGFLSNPDDIALEVVRLSQAIPGLGVEVIGKKTLYMRPFYRDLTALALRPMDQVVLFGNSGVSKSHFQHVILCSLLAKEEEIATATTLMGIRKQFKDINVVVRQLGVAERHVLFIKEKLEYKGAVHVGRLGLFYNLDMSKTLYLFDSGPTDAPVLPTVVHCLSLCTLSPREDRYKGYVKQNGALKIYMPLYKEDELVAIGLDMAKEDDFPTELLRKQDGKQDLTDCRPVPPDASPSDMTDLPLAEERKESIAATKRD
eukprot:gene27379-33070_t